MLKSIFGTILVFVIVALPSRSEAVNKNINEQFQKLLKTEESLREKLNEKLLQSLKNMQELSAIKKNANLDRQLENAINKVDDAKNDLLENHLRIDFLNSFNNVIENSDLADIKTSISKILLDLAQKQIISSTESGNDTNLWVFEIYLSIAIRDIMEPSENLAEFTKKFMVYSSLRDPRTPTEFLKDRDYISR